MNFFLFFFFMMVIMPDTFISKWQAAATADHNIRYIAGNSASSRNVMTLLFFFGVLPASLVALGVGPVARLQYYTKHHEKYARTARDNICRRGELLTRRRSASRGAVSRSSWDMGSAQKQQEGAPKWQWCGGRIVNVTQLQCDTASLRLFALPLMTNDAMCCVWVLIN